MTIKKKENIFKKAIGRPPFEITLEICEQAHDHARNGLTRDEIAVCLGMGTATLFEKMRDYPEFLQAIKKGAEKGKATVANKLYELCMAGNLGAICWFEKTRCGRSDKIDINNTGKITHEHTGISAFDAWLTEWGPDAESKQSPVVEPDRPLLSN